MSGVVHGPKPQRRIVFREAVKNVQQLETMASAFFCLVDVTMSLEVLHDTGWVHQDINTGNILCVDGRGRLADVEYAKCTDDFGGCGARMGTPYFTAIEVSQASYIFYDPALKRPSLTQYTIPRLPDAPYDFYAAKAAYKASRRLKRQRGEIDDTPTLAQALEAALRAADVPPPEFKYNSIHDIESLLWVSYWLVLRTPVSRPADMPLAEWTRRTSAHTALADALFVDFDTRTSVFRGFLHVLRAVPALLPAAGVALKLLEPLREELERSYFACEKDVEGMGLNPAKGLHWVAGAVLYRVEGALRDRGEDVQEEGEDKGEVEASGDRSTDLEDVSEQRLAIEKIMHALDEADARIGRWLSVHAGAAFPAPALDDPHEERSYRYDSSSAREDTRVSKRHRASPTDEHSATVLEAHVNTDD